jgi:hypothetical protein
MRRIVAVSLIAFAGAATSVHAVVLNVDFGDPAHISEYLGWNNIVSNASGGSSLDRLVEESGPLLTVSLTLTDAFHPVADLNGTTTPGGAVATTFPPPAVGDSLFGSVAPYGGITEPTGGHTLGGLDPSGVYSFTFFASFMGATDNREAAYTLLGANTRTAYLNPSNNTSEMATVTGVIPDAAGNIALSVGPGPNNNNPSGFYYLGAMKVVGMVPEPACSSTLALAGAILRRRR